MEKHLKDKQHYIDLYDRYTVERCRRTEASFSTKELPPIEGKEFTKGEAERMRKTLTEYYLHFQTGERYLKKEKTIQEWVDRDQVRDELYESAEAPEGIRCLTCRNLLKPTFKEFWSELDKPDRILFMYDCPNKCLPRRAFFSDGEEWRVKPNLCPQCSTKLDQEQINTEEKLVTKNTCSKCGYTATDELKWTHKKEEPLNENFAADRDRFCLTNEDGRKFQDEKWQLEQWGKFAEEWKEKEKARDEKLKANPKGFHLEGAGYSCFICGGGTPEGDNWYDEYGIKCLVCQKAIDDGEIPASLAKDKDSWYSTYDLESRFNIKHFTLRKWIKEGIIKARTVSRYGEGVHVQVFLLEDNKDFLPPKDMLKSHSVKEVKDGKTWTHMEPWYRFVDPFEHLKGYGIIKHMRVVPPEEVAAREAEEKRKWEERRARRKERPRAQRKK
jgi:Zn ribbon nucleic-acid-binding protein